MSPRLRCFYPFERRRISATATTDFLGPDILDRCGGAVPALWGALHSTLASDAEVAVSPHSPPTLATVIPFWKERKSHSKAVRTVADPEADIAPRLIDAGDPFRPKGGYTSPHAPHCANPKFLIWLIAKPDSLGLDIGRRQWDGVTSVGRFWRQSRALFLPYGQRLFRPQSHVAS